MTTLEIWNAALALLPHDRTVEAEDEDSTEALRCRQHWDAARRAVLAAHDWGFLVRELPVCASQRQCGRYDYPRPTHCLRVLGLFDENGRRVEAEAVNGVFRTREPAAAIRFLADETRPERMPSIVQDAIESELAARLAPVVTGNRIRARDLAEAARAALDAARALDAAETACHGTAGDTFLAARG